MATSESTLVRQDEPPPKSGASETPRRAGRALAILLPIVLLLVAGTLRFYRLGEPGRIYFDETYYANDANMYLDGGVEDDFAVHPPVGKWLIASGIAVFGFDSYGWRFSAAVAGTITVFLLYLIGLRLFRHRGIAALAALLLAVDGLALTMSRIAMLDGFLALFVTLGFWLLLLDRDRQWSGVPAQRPADERTPDIAATAATPPPTDSGESTRALPRRPHLYRWLAGIAFGLGVATKWNGLLAIAAAILFVVASELLWRRRLTGRFWVHPERILGSVAAAFVLVPMVVYVVSYTGWFANFENTRKGADQCPEGVCSGVSTFDIVGAWWDDQREIAGFHRGLDAEHPYRASSLTWPLLIRPVAYYYESCDNADEPPEGGCQVAEGNIEEILGIGNPAIWWLALIAYPVLLVFAIFRRDWRAWAVAAFLLLQYLPWPLLELIQGVLAPDEGPRTLFLFYATPIVPFICLSLAYLAWRTLRPPVFRWVPGTIGVLAVAGFIFFLPIFLGLELSRGSWDLRILFSRWI